MPDDTKSAIDGINMLNDSMERMQYVLQGAARYELIAKYGLEKLVDTYSAATRELSKLTQHYRTHGTVSTASLAAVKEWAKTEAELGRIEAENRQMLEALTFASSKFTEKAHDITSGVSSATSAIRGQIGILVGAGVGYHELTESLLGYNRAQIETIAISRNFGEGLTSIEDAQKAARNETTLSQAGFAEMNKSFKQMYLGIPPTSQAVVEFARNLQERFGYAEDVAIAKTREFLTLQNQVPDALDMITRTQQAYTRSTMDGDKAAAGMLGTLRALGASRGQIQDALTMARPASPAVQQYAQLEQHMSRMHQTQKDLVLHTAQKMQPELEQVADAATAIGHAFDYFATPSILRFIAAGSVIEPMVAGIGNAAGGIKKLSTYFTAMTGARNLPKTAGAAIKGGFRRLFGGATDGAAIVEGAAVTGGAAVAGGALRTRAAVTPGMAQPSISIGAPAGVASAATGLEYRNRAGLIVRTPDMSAGGVNDQYGRAITQVAAPVEEAVAPMGKMAKMAGGAQIAGMYGLIEALSTASQEFSSRQGQPMPQRVGATAIKSGAALAGSVVGGALGTLTDDFTGPMGTIVGAQLGGMGGKMLGDWLTKALGFDNTLLMTDKERTDSLAQQNRLLANIVATVDHEGKVTQSIYATETDETKRRERMLSLIAHSTDATEKQYAVTQLITSGLATTVDLEKALGVESATVADKQQAVTDAIKEAAGATDSQIDKVNAVVAGLDKQVATLRQYQGLLEKQQAYPQAVAAMAHAGAMPFGAAGALQTGVALRTEQLANVRQQRASEMAAAMALKGGITPEVRTAVTAVGGAEGIKDFENRLKGQQDATVEFLKAQTKFNDLQAFSTEAPGERQVKGKDGKMRASTQDDIDDATKKAASLQARVHMLDDRRNRLAENAGGAISGALAQTPLVNADRSEEFVNSETAALDKLSQAAAKAAPGPEQDRLWDDYRTRMSRVTNVSQTLGQELDAVQKRTAALGTLATGPTESQLQGSKLSVDYALKQKELAEENMLGLAASYKYTRQAVVALDHQEQILKRRQGDEMNLLGTLGQQYGVNIDINKAMEDRAGFQEDIERQMVNANKSDAERKNAQSDLNGVLNEYQKTNVDILETDTQKARLTKQQREGYLDAMSEMVAGAGDFSALIGTTTSGATQLLAAGAPDTFRYGGEGHTGYHPTKPIRYTTNYGAMSGPFETGGLAQYSNVNAGYRVEGPVGLQPLGGGGVMLAAQASETGAMGAEATTEEAMNTQNMQVHAGGTITIQAANVDLNGQNAEGNAIGNTVRASANLPAGYIPIEGSRQSVVPGARVTAANTPDSQTADNSRIGTGVLGPVAITRTQAAGLELPTNNARGGRIPYAGGGAFPVGVSTIPVMSGGSPQQWSRGGAIGLSNGGTVGAPIPFAHGGSTEGTSQDPTAFRHLVAPYFDDPKESSPQMRAAGGPIQLPRGIVVPAPTARAHKEVIKALGGMVIPGPSRLAGMDVVPAEHGGQRYKLAPQEAFVQVRDTYGTRGASLAKRLADGGTMPPDNKLSGTFIGFDPATRRAAQAGMRAGVSAGTHLAQDLQSTESSTSSNEDVSDMAKEAAKSVTVNAGKEALENLLGQGLRDIPILGRIARGHELMETGFGIGAAPAAALSMIMHPTSLSADEFDPATGKAAVSHYEEPSVTGEIVRDLWQGITGKIPLFTSSPRADARDMRGSAAAAPADLNIAATEVGTASYRFGGMLPRVKRLGVGSPMPPDPDYTHTEMMTRYVAGSGLTTSLMAFGAVEVPYIGQAVVNAADAYYRENLKTAQMGDEFEYQEIRTGKRGAKLLREHPDAEKVLSTFGLKGRNRVEAGRSLDTIALSQNVPVRDTGGATFEVSPEVSSQRAVPFTRPTIASTVSGIQRATDEIDRTSLLAIGARGVAPMPSVVAPTPMPSKPTEEEFMSQLVEVSTEAQIAAPGVSEYVARRLAPTLLQRRRDAVMKRNQANQEQPGSAANAPVSKEQVSQAYRVAEQTPGGVASAMAYHQADQLAERFAAQNNGFTTGRQSVALPQGQRQVQSTQVAQPEYGSDFVAPMASAPEAKLPNLIGGYSPSRFQRLIVIPKYGDATGAGFAGIESADTTSVMPPAGLTGLTDPTTGRVAWHATGIGPEAHIYSQVPVPGGTAEAKASPLGREARNATGQITWQDAKLGEAGTYARGAQGFTDPDTGKTIWTTSGLPADQRPSFSERAPQPFHLDTPSDLLGQVEGQPSETLKLPNQSIPSQVGVIAARPATVWTTGTGTGYRSGGAFPLGVSTIPMYTGSTAGWIGRQSGGVTDGDASMGTDDVKRHHKALLDREMRAKKESDRYDAVMGPSTPRQSRAALSRTHIWSEAANRRLAFEEAHKDLILPVVTTPAVASAEPQIVIPGQYRAPRPLQSMIVPDSGLHTVPRSVAGDGPLPVIGFRDATRPLQSVTMPTLEPSDEQIRQSVQAEAVNDYANAKEQRFNDNTSAMTEARQPGYKALVASAQALAAAPSKSLDQLAQERQAAVDKVLAKPESEKQAIWERYVPKSEMPYPSDAYLKAGTEAMDITQSAKAALCPPDVITPDIVTPMVAPYPASVASVAAMAAMGYRSGGWIGRDDGGVFSGRVSIDEDAKRRHKTLLAREERARKESDLYDAAMGPSTPRQSRAALSRTHLWSEAANRRLTFESEHNLVSPATATPEPGVQFSADHPTTVPEAIVRRYTPMGTSVYLPVIGNRDAVRPVQSVTVPDEGQTTVPRSVVGEHGPLPVIGARDAVRPLQFVPMPTLQPSDRQIRQSVQAEAANDYANAKEQRFNDNMAAMEEARQPGYKALVASAQALAAAPSKSLDQLAQERQAAVDKVLAKPESEKQAIWEQYVPKSEMPYPSDAYLKAGSKALNIAQGATAALCPPDVITPTPMTAPYSAPAASIAATVAATSIGGIIHRWRGGGFGPPTAPSQMTIATFRGIEGYVDDLNPGPGIGRIVDEYERQEQDALYDSHIAVMNKIGVPQVTAAILGSSRGLPRGPLPSFSTKGNNKGSITKYGSLNDGDHRGITSFGGGLRTNYADGGVFPATEGLHAYTDRWLAQKPPMSLPAGAIVNAKTAQHPANRQILMKLGGREIPGPLEYAGQDVVPGLHGGQKYLVAPREIAVPRSGPYGQRGVDYALAINSGRVQHAAAGMAVASISTTPMEIETERRRQERQASMLQGVTHSINAPGIDELPSSINHVVTGGSAHKMDVAIRFKGKASKFFDDLEVNSDHALNDTYWG